MVSDGSVISDRASGDISDRASTKQFPDNLLVSDKEAESIYDIFSKVLLERLINTTKYHLILSCSHFIIYPTMSLPASITLANRVAIVTGGSRGIGKAIALELASRGASVAIVYSNPQKADTAQETVNEIISLGTGVKAVAILADMKKQDSYKRIVEQTLHGLGSNAINIIGECYPRFILTENKIHDLKLNRTVHNAGITSVTPTIDVTPDEFNAIFDTNVRGPFFLTQAALQYIPSGGRIILISSISARRPSIGAAVPVYAMTKASVESLARDWTYEVSRMN